MVKQDLHKLPAAGMYRRLAAGVYDWLLVTAIIWVLSIPVVALRHDAVAPGDPAYRVMLFLIAGVFFTGFWVREGQTLGMRAWRLRLISNDGGRFAQRGTARGVTLPAALIRYCAAWVAFLPLGMGFWWCLIDREGRAWHDIWSGTRLVTEPKT